MTTYDVLEFPCTLGEGPVWDERYNMLCWVDIIEGTVHRYSPDEDVHELIELNQLVSSIVVREAGGYIVTLQHGFAYLDPETGRLEDLAVLDQDLCNRFNDGKCDPSGRFWAGTMNMEDGASTGSLYTLEPNMEVSVKIRNVACANGLAWNASGDRFYFIDTPTRKVVAYDYDQASGMIFNERTVVEIPAEEGLPDGMTIDADGMLWVALWDGWGISRYDPATGECLDRIKLPVSRVTSCTFGGKDYKDLYITTARVGLTARQLHEQPLAGCVFVCKHTGYTTGLPSTYFLG